MTALRPVRNQPPSDNDDSGRALGRRPQPAPQRARQNPATTQPSANQQKSEESPCAPWTEDDVSRLADLWLEDSDAEAKTAKWCDLVKATGDAALIDAAYALLDMAEAEWERRKAKTRS